jgi:hypothetical protein
MRKNDSHREPIHKRKRTSVTVNDILTRDDVNGILANLNGVKPHITAAIVIYLDEADVYHWQMTEGTFMSQAVWMLESTKLDLLNSGEE